MTELEDKICGAIKDIPTPSQMQDMLADVQEQLNVPKEVINRKANDYARWYTEVLCNGYQYAVGYKFMPEGNKDVKY